MTIGTYTTGRHCFVSTQRLLYGSVSGFSAHVALSGDHSSRVEKMSSPAIPKDLFFRASASRNNCPLFLKIIILLISDCFFERWLQHGAQNENVATDRKLENNSFRFFLNPVMPQPFEKMMYMLNPLWFWHVTVKKKKSKALFFDKVWGPKIEKSTRYWGGWINTIEIVFIRLIRKVHSLKTIMADIIMTAFNFLQRHVLSAHRYLAVCGALHKVRQTWSLFTAVLTIVRRLCWEHNFLLAAVVWKTLLVIICAVWVFDFWGVFSFSFLSFNYTVQSGILSSGDVAGWLQVGGGSALTELGVCLYRMSSLSFLAALQVLCPSVVTLISYTLSLPISPFSTHCSAVTSSEVTVD